MNTEIIELLDKIIIDEFPHEFEVYSFEKSDALKSLNQGINITLNKNDEFENGLGIPEPGILAWIPILYTTYTMQKQIIKGIFKDNSLGKVKSNFENDLIRNGLEKKKAKQLTSKYFKRIYKVINQKTIT